MKTMLQGRRGTIKTASIALKNEGNKSSVIKLCNHGRLKDAMSITGQRVDSWAYDSVLQECFNNNVLPQSKLVHAHMIQTGFKYQDTSIGNKLVSMYAKCRSLVDSRNVFNQMPERNVVSWTVIIAAYARHGYCEQALALFYEMRRTNIQPNQFTYATLVAACAKVASLEKGKEIYEEISRHGFQSDVFVGNALVDMFAKCGSIGNARHVFDKMPHRDVVSWTVMIAGCAQNGHDEEALKLFRQMQFAGVKPNSKTFTSVLPACANLTALERGLEVHEDIIRSGFLSDVCLGNALIDMYAKCGSIENARYVFDKVNIRTVVSWTVMIGGYAQNGFVDEAMKLFQKMSERNVVSWTVMIAGYAQNGYSKEALKLYQQMQVAGVIPNLKTFTSILPACADLAALEQGMQIHEEIIRSGFESDVFVGSALVDMYAKCGSIEYARQVFDKKTQRDVVSWNAMIAGYAMHGYGKEALKLFEHMQHSSSIPDHITFIGVLSACAHAGLVDEGRQYFNCMSQNYRITPVMEHYGCIVDLLGRAGHLDEAHDYINKMPIKPNAAVWECLLGACRIHSNMELGERVAEYLFELDPKNAVPYVLLSNIYAAKGRWDGIEKVRKVMKDRRVTKKPGCSWIEVNKQVNVFLVRDR
eukprot:Gb_16757 [translate_table: standard]